MRNPISVLRFQLIPDLQIKTGVKELSSWARLAQQVTMRGEEGTRHSAPGTVQSWLGSYST